MTIAQNSELCTSGAYRSHLNVTHSDVLSSINIELVLCARYWIYNGEQNERQSVPSSIGVIGQG